MACARLGAIIVDVTIVNALIYTPEALVVDARARLLAGNLALPIELGLGGMALRSERDLKECFQKALLDLPPLLGAAARVIECGAMAGHQLGQVLDVLERPKAGVVLSANFDTKQLDRLKEVTSTAEIMHVKRDAWAAMWQLQPTGTGKTLVLISGAGFALLSDHQTQTLLSHASNALNTGDFIALTLEAPRDGAILEASYADWGRKLVSNALTRIGRAENITERTFYDVPSQRIRFGGVAGGKAAISWNGTRCELTRGAWIDLGGIKLADQSYLADLHPDFSIHQNWTTQDQMTSLVLLQKV
jgi:hypothetical protein